MWLFKLLLIGISLSIDAFSLAVSLKTKYKEKIKSNNYSISVGIFHFFMPILGFIGRIFINKIILIPSDLIFNIVIIFILIGILIDKENDNKEFINPFIFGFSVSLDSFSVGLTLNKNNILFGSIIFSLISFLLTKIGFKTGEYINQKFNSLSKFVSVFLLLIVLILNLIS